MLSHLLLYRDLNAKAVLFLLVLEVAIFWGDYDHALLVSLQEQLEAILVVRFLCFSFFGVLNMS